MDLLIIKQSWYRPRLIQKLKTAFIEHYGKLMTQAAIKGRPILFGNSVHPSQQTRASYDWVKKGKDKLLEVNSGRKRINLMGALNLENMRLTQRDHQ